MATDEAFNLFVPKRLLPEAAEQLVVLDEVLLDRCARLLVQWLHPRRQVDNLDRRRRPIALTLVVSAVVAARLRSRVLLRAS